jgi:hypothetical protein
VSVEIVISLSGEDCRRFYLLIILRRIKKGPREHVRRLQWHLTRLFSTLIGLSPHRDRPFYFLSFELDDLHKRLYKRNMADTKGNSANEIPPLFKYLPPQRVDVISNLRIRFTQASSLNDASEFQPPYKGVGKRSVIEKGVRERFRSQHPTEFAQVYIQFAPDIKRAEKFIDEIMVPEWIANVEANREKTIAKIYEELDTNFGLLSLSETVTSILMWSFYADGGRGFVIEFDPAHAWFDAKRTQDDSFRHLRRVKYVGDRPPEDILSTKDDGVMYTKTREWEFEMEWRIVQNFNNAAVISKKDPYGKDVLLFDVPPSSINSIVFGYKMLPKQEEDLREMVAANSDLKHVIFRRAIRKASGYIEIVPALASDAR